MPRRSPGPGSSLLVAPRALARYTSIYIRRSRYAGRPRVRLASYRPPNPKPPTPNPKPQTPTSNYRLPTIERVPPTRRPSDPAKILSRTRKIAVWPDRAGGCPVWPDDDLPVAVSSPIQAVPGHARGVRPLSRPGRRTRRRPLHPRVGNRGQGDDLAARSRRRPIVALYRAGFLADRTVPAHA